MKKIFTILMIVTLTLTLTLNYKNQSLAKEEKNDNFSQLLDEYRTSSSLKAFDGKKDVTDSFKEILKLDDEDTIINKIQQNFENLKIQREKINNNSMFRYAPSTINKTMHEEAFHHYKTSNGTLTWYTKITVSFNVNVNTSTISSVDYHNASFHKVGSNFSNLVLKPSINNSYYKILGGGSHMLVSYSYGMYIEDTNGNPKYWAGNFNDTEFFYVY